VHRQTCYVVATGRLGGRSVLSIVNALVGISLTVACQLWRVGELPVFASDHMIATSMLTRAGSGAYSRLTQSLQRCTSSLKKKCSRQKHPEAGNRIRPLLDDPIGLSMYGEQSSPD